MTFSGPIPTLYVTDIPATIDFYRDVLGFTCANQTDAWAALSRDSAEIILSLPNAHLPFEKSLFTGSFYFRVSDVDSVWNALKDKTEIVYPIESFDYGMREFAIRDCNNYILQFGQQL